MEMQLLPWIKDDIAIEIIGKMIAEQTEQLYELYEAYNHAGFGYEDPIIVSHPKYQQIMKHIADFKTEIDDIYAGIGLEELYKKVEEVYVPHLSYGSNNFASK